MSGDLTKLAKPFPSKYVHSNPSGGGSYVKHHFITQKLLADLGAYEWRIAEVIRGYVDERPPNPNGNSAKAKRGSPALPNAIVGCIGELTVTVDGHRITVQGAGDCEDPQNWAHDGARLKDAESDAKKRAALHLGVGLHLWAQDEYILSAALDKRYPDAPVSTVNLVGEPEKHRGEPATPPGFVDGAIRKTDANREHLAAAKAVLQGQLGATESHDPAA